MNFMGLLHLAFVSFTDTDTAFDFLDFFLCLLFKLFVIVLDVYNCFLYLVDLVVLVLLCVLVYAFHAHYFSLLLAKKHQILFMNVAESRNTAGLRASFTTVGVYIFCWFFIAFWILAGFASTFCDIRCFALGPYIWETLRVGHFFKLPLSIFRLLTIIVVNGLSQRTLIEFWALHVIEEEFIIFLVD